MNLKPGYFHEEIHVTAAAAVGSGDGKSYASAKGCLTGDLWPIPAGVLIKSVSLIVDVAVTGSTVVNIGDDDDADGYVPTASLTLGTAGLYGGNSKVQGAYLRVSTDGGTDPADVYVVPNQKYYAATGKEVKMAVTGTWTAGKFRVVIEGLYLLS